MRIKELREFNHIQQKELASTLNISPNTLSQYESFKREPGIEVVAKISDYFNVSVDFLYGKADITTCKKCGLTYDPLDETDKFVHDDLHKRWENALNKHGSIITNTVENEKIKAENRQIVSDNDIPLNIRFDAQLLIFKCLFSRSLDASNYSENHIDFSTYISMLLNQEHTKRNMAPDLYDMFLKKYGQKPGIENGETYFYAYEHTEEPFTLAAHFEGGEYTDDELEEIRQFAAFVKNKRK